MVIRRIVHYFICFFLIFFFSILLQSVVLWLIFVLIMVMQFQFAIFVRPSVHWPVSIEGQIGQLAFIVMFIDKGANNFSGLIVVEKAFRLILAKINNLDSFVFWFAFKVFRDGVE